MGEEDGTRRDGVGGSGEGDEIEVECELWLRDSGGGDEGG